jgi:hypothetical protein
MMRVEQLPYSGHCTAEVRNKRLRRFNSRTTDYTCNLVTCLIVDGEWRCRHHLADGKTFVLKGIFEEAVRG